MRKKTFAAIVILLPIFGFLALNGGWYFLNDRFMLSHIQADLPKGKQTWTEPDEIRTLLSQKFHYLGRGSQAFVFESEDGEYVLKLINFKRLRLPFWLQQLPYPTFLEKIRQNKMVQKRKKQQKLVKSLRLAKGELKQECGLVYTHLKRSQQLQSKLEISDKLQRSYTLNADATPFILQKRGELIYPYLLNLIEQNEMEKAKSALEKLVNLVNSRMQKGIDDHDPYLAKNAAFCADEPLFIDVGQFVRNHSIKAPAAKKKAIYTLTRRLHGWLENKSPELADHLDNLIEII